MKCWSRLALCGLWLILFSACSLLIDVEPNCDVAADCTPYVCNADNTACLTGCRLDADCAAGFACDVGRSVCVGSGCIALGPTRESGELVSSLREVSGAALFPFFATLQYAPSQPVQILLYSIEDGGLLQPGPEAVPLSTANPGTDNRTRNSAALWSRGAQVGTTEDILLTLWLENDPRSAGTPHRLVGRAMQFNPNEPVYALGPVQRVADRRQQPLALQLRTRSGGFWAAWFERSPGQTAETVGKLQFLRLNALGAPLLGEPIVFPSGTATVRGWSGMARSNAGVLFGTVIQEGGQSRVVGGLLPNEGASLGTPAPWHSTTSPVTDVAIGSGGPNATVVWRERQADGAFTLQALRLSGEGTRLDAETPQRIDPDFTHTLSTRPSLAMVDGVNESLLLFTGRRQERSGLWLTRFGRDGQQVGLPFPVAERNLDVSRMITFHAVPTERGYVVQWVERLEDDENARRFFYRAFRCTP